MKPCPDTFPFPLVALDETASTNQYLSQLCNQLQESVAELTTVTAEFQTAGKGQRGNTWEAEEGKNLLFSFVLYPSFLEARRQFILSQIVSLAIKEELSRWSDEITIKWPNDIYWKDKKICGILIENDLSGHHIRRSIAGIGININQEVFNSDAPNPVSLVGKADIDPHTDKLASYIKEKTGKQALTVSAKTGAGIDAVREELARLSP